MRKLDKEKRNEYNMLQVVHYYNMLQVVHYYNILQVVHVCSY